MDSGHGLIAWIIIGLLAGWITGKLMKGSGFGFFMDMVVGLVGALIGGFLSSHLGFGGVGQHGLIISIFIAVIGAVILTFLVRLISGNRGANLLASDRQTQKGHAVEAWPFYRIIAGDHLISHTVARAVPSAQRGLTSVFGMGTGDPSQYGHRQNQEASSSFACAQDFGSRHTP